MKPGDEVFAIFQDYDIVPVKIRNVGINNEGAYVVREGQNPNDARYFRNKWLFNTKLEAIRNCQKRLVVKIKNNVEFYNMLNDQIADAVTEDVMGGRLENDDLEEKKVLDRGYF